jgi:phosphate transport system protein
MTHRTRTSFDRSFANIQRDLLELGEAVDVAIGRSLESLARRDPALAQQVVTDDEGINELRFRVEEACLALMATQQPTATDLRLVVAALSVVVDMERMGDHATGIAKTVLRMGDEPFVKPLHDIPRMADLSREMLREVLQAFLRRDESKAREIALRDDEVDHLYKAVFDELVAIMARDPSAVAGATYLLWCAHNLERIGDRVTNIAERVVFVTTGDMRELNR